MSVFRIKLSGLRFYGRIGVFNQERAVGNEYVVDMAVEIPGDSFEEENLDTSISYADIYEIIREEMGRETLLLESVAVRISKRVKERWPKIEKGTVSIEKEGVPISGIDGRCGIEYLF